MGKSGFEFSGSGRLDRIDTFTTKAGKDIVTLVLQVEGAYPQLVPIKFFGRLADAAAALTKGDVVEVTGHLGGRDWNGKVYGDIVGETLDVVVASGQHRGGGEQQEMPSADPRRESLPPPPSDDSIPF
jgi:single-stranded DNA-binding protein